MYNILVSNRYTFLSCIKDTRNLKHKFIIEDVSVHTDSTIIIKKETVLTKFIIEVTDP